jgi:hypothetical protein
MRNAILTLIVLTSSCTSASRPGSLLDVKARAMRAGYTADLGALAAAARDAQALAADPAIAPLAHYWAGYAFWQRAVNDVNRNVAAEQVAADRAAALAEMDAAIAARESFADAHAIAAWLHGWLYTADPAHQDAHAAAIRAHLTRARELEPDNPRVLWAYATALQFRDRPGSLRLFDELTQRPDTRGATTDPDWGLPEALMSRAWMHANQEGGDLAAAETLARRALELRPGWYYIESILIPQIEAKKAHGLGSAGVSPDRLRVGAGRDARRMRAGRPHSAAQDTRTAAHPPTARRSTAPACR